MADEKGHEHWKHGPLPHDHEHEHDAPRARHDLRASRGSAEGDILTASMMAVLADVLARSGQATIDGNISDITGDSLYARIIDPSGLVKLDGDVNLSAWVHLAMQRIRGW